VLRGHAGEPTHVLVLATLGAPQRRLLRPRRPRRVASQPGPSPVETSRATLIAALPFAAGVDGERWLTDVDAQVEVESSLVILDRVLHLHSAASADHSVRPLAGARALAIRVGIGSGEQVADGIWARARELRPASFGARPNAALRSDERLAALLAGRDVVLACETLTLRAREDLDSGRQREAALQMRIALDAALSELAGWTHRGDLTQRLDELRALVAPVHAAAEAALSGGLDAAATADVDHALARLEAALRARSALGFS